MYQLPARPAPGPTNIVTPGDVWSRGVIRHRRSVRRESAAIGTAAGPHRACVADCPLASAWPCHPLTRCRLRYCGQKPGWRLPAMLPGPIFMDPDHAYA